MSKPERNPRWRNNDGHAVQPPSEHHPWRHIYDKKRRKLWIKRRLEILRNQELDES